MTSCPAKRAILCVKDTVLAEPFRGVLRKEDVRATEKDFVEVYNCFRLNDIILVRVVSFFSVEMTRTDLPRIQHLACS